MPSKSSDIMISAGNTELEAYRATTFLDPLKGPIKFFGQLKGQTNSRDMSFLDSSLLLQ
jgi:hypothetical protein